MSLNSYELFFYIDNESEIPFYDFHFKSNYADEYRESILFLITVIYATLFNRMRSINEDVYYNYFREDYEDINTNTNNDLYDLFDQSCVELNYDNINFYYLIEFFSLSEVYDNHYQLYEYDLVESKFLDLKEMKKNSVKLTGFDERIIDYILNLKDCLLINIKNNNEIIKREEISSLQKNNYKINFNEENNIEKNKDIENYKLKYGYMSYFIKLYPNFSIYYDNLNNYENKLLNYVIYLIHYYIVNKLISKKKNSSIIFDDIINELNLLKDQYFNFNSKFKIYYKLKDEKIFMDLIQESLKKNISNIKFQSYREFSQHISDLESIILEFSNKMNEDNFNYYYKNRDNSENFLLHIIIRFYHFILELYEDFDAYKIIEFNSRFYILKNTEDRLKLMLNTIEFILSQDKFNTENYLFKIDIA